VQATACGTKGLTEKNQKTCGKEEANYYKEPFCDQGATRGGLLERQKLKRLAKLSPPAAMARCSHQPETALG
jgi:hypothetical protein